MLHNLNWTYMNSFNKSIQINLYNIEWLTSEGSCPCIHKFKTGVVTITTVLLYWQLFVHNLLDKELPKST